MASNKVSSNRDHLAKCHRRDYDVEDTSSSNHEESIDRATHSTNDHAQSSSLKEKDPVKAAVSAPTLIPNSSERNTSQQAPAPTYIPKWMPLMFRPPSHMPLSNTELEVAAYIFMGSGIFDGKEILMSSLHGKTIGDRQTLKTIMPTSYISTEVMKLVVSLLNNYKSLMCVYATCWFFPPEFFDLSKEYRNPYMGYVDMIRKIYVPINDEGLYWYLLVIDLEYEKMWFLDSNPFHGRNNWRMLHAKKLVNAQSRMRLTLDLVLDRHNQLRDEIVKKAYHEFMKLTQGWDKILNLKKLKNRSSNCP
ncbi:Ulp1 protease family, C-terminal catalytic domain [Sesbania bispinosa]|nr:Ulp1 protease family, C-terminal catalytic domain [Sesbania bispinosa]